MRWLLRRPERDGSRAEEASGMPTLSAKKSNPAECGDWQSILVHRDQPEPDAGGQDRVNAAPAGSGCMVLGHPALKEMPGRGRMPTGRQTALRTTVLPPQNASAAPERRAAVGFVKSAASAALRGLVCGSKAPRSPAESPERRSEVEGVDVGSQRNMLQESSHETWAQQRREVSTDVAGERFGCFGGGVSSWAPQAFSWRRSASASRQVALRLRQRRHGCSLDKSKSARSQTESAIHGTPQRSQSCSPASSVLRHRAGAAAQALSSPGAASWDSASSADSTSPALRSLQERSLPSPQAVLPSEVLPLSLLDVDALDIVACGSSCRRSCSAPPVLGLLAGPAPADVPSPARLSPAGVTRAAPEAQTWTWQANIVKPGNFFDPIAEEAKNRCRSSSAPSALPSLPWPVPRDGNTTLLAGSNTNIEQIDGSETSPGRGRRPTFGSGEPAISHMPVKKNSASRPSLRETRLHEAQQLLERMLVGSQGGGPGAAFVASSCHGMTMRNAAHDDFKVSGAPTLRCDSGPGRCLGRHASAPPAGGRNKMFSDASSSGGALCSVAPPALGRVKAAPLQPLNGCMPWFPAAALQDPSLPRGQDAVLPQVSAVA